MLRGQKVADTTNYRKAIKRNKRKYGADIYKKWGKLGGNPILLKCRRKRDNLH